MKEEILKAAREAISRIDISKLDEGYQIEMTITNKAIETNVVKRACMIHGQYTPFKKKNYGK